MEISKGYRLRHKTILISIFPWTSLSAELKPGFTFRITQKAFTTSRTYPRQLNQTSEGETQASAL